MKKKITYLPAEPVEKLILIIRGQKVILDADLARIYGGSTKVLNQAVKRNADRFPPDFVFQLTKAEKTEVVTICDHLQKLKFSPVFPYAFTEHGAIMAASVLNSPQAVQMSVFVVRAFVKMREVLAQNRVLADKLAELEAKLTSRLDSHEKAIVLILRELRELMNPSPQPVNLRDKIGFSVRERRARYGVKA